MSDRPGRMNLAENRSHQTCGCQSRHDHRGMHYPTAYADTHHVNRTHSVQLSSWTDLTACRPDWTHATENCLWLMDGEWRSSGRELQMTGADNVKLCKQYWWLLCALVMVSLAHSWTDIHWNVDVIKVPRSTASDTAGHSIQLVHHI